jgi:hypothetical protein
MSGPGAPGQDAEDARQAVLIAVEAAKQLMAVGVVVLVGIATLAQFALDKGGSSRTGWLLGAAALFTLVSLVEGMRVIARAYRGAAGLVEDQAARWDVGRLRGPLRWQAWFGLAALVIATAVLATWRTGAAEGSPDLVLAEPYQDPVRVFATPLRMRGDLRGLRFREGDGPEIALTDVAGEVTLTCRPAR